MPGVDKVLRIKRVLDGIRHQAVVGGVVRRQLSEGFEGCTEVQVVSK